MVNVGNNSYIPDITAIVHIWCNPAFLYSCIHRIQFTVIRCFVIAALTVFLCPLHSNQQWYSWHRRRQRACLAWLGMPGVLRRRGRYDVQSSAIEVPSASFAKALFSEAVKVIIARKTKYYVHCEYYTLVERF